MNSTKTLNNQTQSQNQMLSEEEQILSDNWNLIQTERLSDKYIIGIYRVLFGFRIRVVENTQPAAIECKIDWCCQNNQVAISVYSRFIKTLVKTSKLKDNIIDILPVASEIKPIYLDDKFNDYINKISEEHDGICIIKEIREELKKMDNER